MKRIDKIRQMSSEELAKVLFLITERCCVDFDCEMCPLENADCCSGVGVMEWLEEEVQEDDSEHTKGD